MAKQPKRAIKLFGTEVPEPKVKTLPTWSTRRCGR